MGTARFEESLKFTLKWEGSEFTNDPDDHGGATRYGVIQREYDRYRNQRSLPERSVEWISMDEVRDIYRYSYWATVQGDRMPDPVDIVMFDTAVLMGVGRAIRFLQSSLNIGVDGVIGSETLEALTVADADEVGNELLDRREARLRRIVEVDPVQGKFLKGWLNRLNDLRQTIRSLDTRDFVAKSKSLSTGPEGAMGRAVSDPVTDFAKDGDDNPAEPTADLMNSLGSDLVVAISRANYGAESADDRSLHSLQLGAGLREASPFFTSRTLPIDIEPIRGFLDSCINSSPRVTYGLGAKIHPHGAVPGKDFTQVDCSGFVREAVWRGTSPGMNFPDGSVVQHDWIRAQGFLRCERTDAMLHDGRIRIAFFRPQEAPPPRHIGHVALVHNSFTLESHGGVGPDSRAWTNTGWQAKAFVYVLAE